ncbi:MAG: glucose-6-phosphate isomerase [Oscillospiraceae bacterium]|nr:glucose-6-phosphate isomerase [Oscillospiraceae bacterium]
MSIQLETKHLTGFVSQEQISALKAEMEKACHEFDAGTCQGNDFIGWRTLPTDYDKEEFARIKAAAGKIRANSQVLVVIGIGGSYLGARAAIEFLGSQYYNNFADLQVYFVGNSICPEELSKVLKLCEGKDVSVNIISKSGTTTEPAIAFRVFKEYMENRYGKEEASKRIYATTDKARGTLKELSTLEGYETFVVPDDVGGRYSVLTAVGLLPIAAAGFDIDALMAGAQAGQKAFDNDEMNPCNLYAVIRNVLYRMGKKTELYTCYDPAFTMFNEWLKQLYGESEGKDGKGIFPASVIFSTDLHSMGQYIQDGERTLFETVLAFGGAREDVTVKAEEANFDGLNYLAGKTMSEINRTAMEATIMAHKDGGVPCMVIEVGKMDEYHLGELVYFFEHACAISGAMLGVNPFNQPGVEAYKKNMFKLLGKPGY